MSEITENHCSYWSGIPQEPQTEFTRRAIGILCKGFRTGPWNLLINWKRVDWHYGNGVSFVVRSNSLATWDFDQLTRLVIGAHDECIRLEISPCSFQYIRISMWPRKGREGPMHSRHPTIEDAIATYRRLSEVTS